MKRHFIYLLNRIFICLLVIVFFQCRKTNDTEASYHLSIDKIFPNIGEAGTLITVSGKGYSLILAEDTVWFNGKSAQIKLVTDSTIQVFAPSNNTTGIITVSVRGKTVNGPTFTYVQKDEPAITQITPEAGWDYTMNSVTIKGIHFGTDANKILVLFDNMPASLQSFSDTSLIVAPPQHAAGKVPVVVIVNGKTSNTVYYTYQLKPVITKVYRESRQLTSSPHYYLAAQNLSVNDGDIAVSVNGQDVAIAAIYRAGSEPYNDPPAGDKIMLNEDDVDNKITSNTIDFIVTSSGLQSDAYRFENDPLITNITTPQRKPYSFGGGDTITIDGKYFGTQTQSSVVEIWDSINTTIHFTPDPTILSWSNTSISLILPSYTIRADSLTMKIKVKENGKEADAYAVYYKQQPQQPPGECLIISQSGSDPNQRPYTYKLDGSGRVILVNIYQQGFLFDSIIVSADQILERSADGYSAIRTVYLQSNSSPANIYEKKPDSAVQYVSTGGRPEEIFIHYRFLYDNSQRLIQLIQYNAESSYYTYMYFTYDGNSNLTQIRVTRPLEPPDYPVVTTSCTNYDNKHSPFLSLSYSVFLTLRDFAYSDILFSKLSKNNPLNELADNYSFQYTYQYNTNGYPLIQNTHYQSGNNVNLYNVTYGYQCR